MSKLIIVRGLPGSGKTTYAKKLADALNCAHYEADQFFTDANGVYTFDFTKLTEAHDWCYDRVNDELEKDLDVVVSNTFTTLREIDHYVIDGSVRGYDVVIYQMTRYYGSIHDVPMETVQRMAKRWMPNADLAKLESYVGVKFYSIGDQVPT